MTAPDETPSGITDAPIETNHAAAQNAVATRVLELVAAAGVIPNSSSLARTSLRSLTIRGGHRQSVGGSHDQAQLTAGAPSAATGCDMPDDSPRGLPLMNVVRQGDEPRRSCAQDSLLRLTTIPAVRRNSLKCHVPAAAHVLLLG